MDTENFNRNQPDNQPFLMGIDIGSTTSACNQPTSAAPASAFQSMADPQTPGGTGTRYFASDTRGTIFQHTASMPTTAAIPSAAVPVQ